MADAIIAAQAVQSTPAGYQVPQQQEIIVKAVRASVDGSGAAASFIPVLQLISPSGLIAWEAPSSTAIAAGGSADVSWFPRVGFGAGNSFPGQMVSTYQGQATASNFTWTGPAATTVDTPYPVNSTWTKFVDNTAILIVSEGDFIPGAAADNLTMGVWIDGINEINVACGTVGSGAFSSVQLARIISPTSLGSGPLAAGTHSINVKVSSFTGQTTTFNCHSATDLQIIEYFPGATQ